jgi:hypothetical protein
MRPIGATTMSAAMAPRDSESRTATPWIATAAEGDEGALAGAGEAVGVAGVLGLEAVVDGEGAGAEDPEQEQAGLVVGVDEGGEQRGGEGGVDVAGLIEAVDLADAEAGLDQAEEGDRGPGAGDQRRADAPRELGGGDVEGGQAEQAGGLEGAVPGDR